MPTETQTAVYWAVQQQVEYDGEVYNVKDGERINSALLVDFVRQYFNDNSIEYLTFSYTDLQPYLV